MKRDAWYILLCVILATGAGFLGRTVWLQDQELAQSRVEVAKVRTEADQSKSEGEARQARLGEIQQLLEQARAQAERLSREMSQATNNQQRLEAEMRSALQSRDVAISELQGKLTVNILDRILFDSGEAQLKPEGMKVLDQVAGVLAGFTNRQIQVFGHTDNRPIRLRYPSNWELSMARAVAAVRYLSEKAGVEPRRLSAVGCGEHQPIADNATPEGRARNRRIALVVLPEQFTPTDVTGAVTNAVAGDGAGGTNAPPSGASPVTSTNLPASGASTNATKLPAEEKPARPSTNSIPSIPALPASAQEPESGQGQGQGAANTNANTNARPTPNTNAVPATSGAKPAVEPPLP